MCMKGTNMWRIRENSEEWMQKKWGEMSLGSLRVTLECMMTLFRMNDVHQGI